MMNNVCEVDVFVKLVGLLQCHQAMVMVLLYFVELYENYTMRERESNGLVLFLRRCWTNIDLRQEGEVTQHVSERGIEIHWCHL
jgi:hypothetical protein